MTEQALIRRLRKANPVPAITQPEAAAELFAQIVASPGDSSLTADLQFDAPAKPQASAPAIHAGPHVRSWCLTRRARWLAVSVVSIVAVPAVAYATGAFTNPQMVAKSLPAGARIFGSTPTCTVVKPNDEYRCTLAKAPPPDPITHLTPQQWRKLGARPPRLGKITLVNRRYKDSNGQWQIGQFVQPQEMPRLERITREYRNQVLASFGFTPAQIQAHNHAIDGDAAGIAAGKFKGTVEPTVDTTHHINGGCRAINSTGTQWDCYLGQAAVKQEIVGDLGAYAPGPGVG